jgi:UDP-N-acetylmuramoyl-L-alanyl-D-glutamate--2,6-diaminopimelate ligase
MKLSDVIQDLHNATISGDRFVDVTDVAFDSRDVRPGTLFVALRGGYTDGHNFLQHARDAGAIAAVVERTANADAAGYTAVVSVENTRSALAHLATRFFGAPSRSMTVVGVTGTDGKTTTSHFIDSVCRAAGHRTGVIGTVEIRIGDDEDMHESRQTTPESLHIQRYLHLMRERHVNTAILEATSHGLELHRLDGCAFDVGVVTNITHEHLDFHGTVERYRAAKGGLLRRVDDARLIGKRGFAVVNIDDEGARSIEHFAGESRILHYSLAGHPDADVWAESIDLRADGSTFSLRTPGTDSRVTIHLPGRYNIANALAAAATGLALDIDPAAIVSGLQNLVAVPGRMQRVVGGQPFAVIVDYAHSPEAIRNVLQEARRMTSSRVLVLFGSAGERDIEKRSVQGAVAMQHADFAVFTSEDPRYEDPGAIIEAIATGAAQVGGRRGVDFECIEDRRKAIQAVFAQASPGDVVILAGKGHERSMIYGAEKRPWDEAAVALEALREIGYGASSQDETVT